MKAISVRIVILGALFACGLFGQSDSGTIVGTVTDPWGAVIPNATVKISNDGTGLIRTAVTNAIGQYRADSFPPDCITPPLSTHTFPHTCDDSLHISPPY